MDEIAAALVIIDQLIAARKSAVASANSRQIAWKADDEVLKRHRSALRTLREARRLLVECQKSRARGTV